MQKQFPTKTPRNNNPQNRINLSSFDEIVSIVDFDSKLKSLLYPQIMQIETISKNIVLQILVEEYKTDEFNVIYYNTISLYNWFRNDFIFIRKRRKKKK